MSLGHGATSFNHSCLKVPVDSFSRKPSPMYERLSSAKEPVTKSTGEQEEEEENKQFPLSDLYASVKSYLEFYQSIPDYTQLHHLSNEEFYSRLKSLKITQKRFCSGSAIATSVHAEEGSTGNGKPFVRASFPLALDHEKTDHDSGICACCCCCCACSSLKVCCDGYEKKVPSKVADHAIASKRSPIKLNITSDNENASDFFEPEFKKHSGYEADQESSTLQVGQHKKSNKKRIVENEDLLDGCNRRSRSMPISPGCERDTPEFCHRFSEISFRNDGCSNRYSSGYCLSEKDKRPTVKKSRKSHSRAIPLTSRIPLFDKIMMEKEARRRIIHERYSEELKSLVKPFSFTKKEEAKEKIRMISSNPELTSIKPPLVRFKAKPIPRNLFSNYAYKRMKEEEFYRALRKRIRAEELLKSSSLPPSMASREKMKYRSKSLDYIDCRSPKKTWDKASGYRKTGQDIGKEIEFDEKKSPKRKSRSTWFSGNRRRINSATDSSTEASPYESVLQGTNRRKGRPHSAFCTSRNNLASVLRIETARKRLEKEMEEKLKESRSKKEAKFKARLVRMTPAWKALNFDKEEELALRVAARRQEERLTRENHRKLMDSIYLRVHRMPPLFHRQRFSKEKCSSKTRSSVSSLPDNDFAEPYNVDDHSEDLHQENEKDSHDFSSGTMMDQKGDYPSREPFQSSTACKKTQKENGYGSDHLVWHNQV